MELSEKAKYICLTKEGAPITFESGITYIIGCYRILYTVSELASVCRYTDKEHCYMTGENSVS